MSQTTGILLFVVGILVSIMIHEWGHLVTARRFGMRADRYFLGFGPTLWSTRPGETEYGVKALPLGGFVRILGMSPDDRRLPGIADQWLDPDRRAAAHDPMAAVQGARGGGANTVLEGQSVEADTGHPPGTAGDLEVLLGRRGTPRDVTAAIMAAVGDADGDDPAQARAALEAALDEHVPADAAHGDTGSLAHRLRSGDRGRFFGDKPAWQRAIVLASGSALHFTIAAVLLLGGLLLLAQPTGAVTNVVDGVQPDSPAAAVGMLPGDELVAVEGVASEDFLELRDVIQAHPDEQITLQVRRDGELVTLTPTPMAATDPETGEQVGVVGFMPEAETTRMGVGDALYETFLGEASIPAMTWASFRAIFDVFGPDGIGAMFSQITGVEERTTDGGISMVGGAAVTGQGVSTYGLMFLVSMLVSINVFIGVFNMLPLPPLDGGHLAVLAVEKAVNLGRRARGRPADFRVRHETVASIAIPVLVLIATVGLGLVWLDITNPIQLP